LASSARTESGEFHLREGLPALVARHDRAAPRYTSYPTVPVWTDRFGPDDYARELARAASPLSVYLHVPFCERLCTYCACNRTITRNHAVAGPYLDSLAREAELLRQALGGPRPSAQLAIGGGTPTFLSEVELARAIAILDESFPAASGAERGIELDPRVTRPGHLDVLAEHGFTRVSMGVQDLDPRVQQAIRRIQTLEQTQRVAESARKLGMRSIAFDLIYGLPLQTEDSFERTLDQVIEARPDRIALYSYAHVTWVSPQQRGFESKDLPDAERKLAIFLLALDRLEAAGYVHLGLDHFALPHDTLARAAASGKLQRNFMGYTVREATQIVALGPSGISELERAYAQACREPREWAARIAQGTLPTARGLHLSADDVRRRWLVQRLMCAGEIDPAAYAMRFGEPLGVRVPDLCERLAAFVNDGLLECRSGHYSVTRLGRLFLRTVATVFDAHLERSGPERAKFSRTI
jgi:oxygen-independent coproporphyrinogen III oxidase